jgi:lysozyme family protein
LEGQTSTRQINACLIIKIATTIQVVAINFQNMQKALLLFAMFAFLQVANGQANVNVFLARTYEYEGGSKFTSTEFDGHFTKFGIILPTLQKWHSETKFGDFDNNKIVNWNDVRLLSWSDATQIYKNLYWDKCKADEIKSQRIANIIVDFVVNSGFRKDFLFFLQKKIGVAQDGKIGPKTIQAINSTNECELFNALLVWRLDYYKRITKSTPRLKGLLNGLKNRLKKICCNDNYNYKKNEKSKNYIIIADGCSCLPLLQEGKPHGAIGTK